MNLENMPTRGWQELQPSLRYCGDPRRGRCWLADWHLLPRIKSLHVTVSKIKVTLTKILLYIYINLIIILGILQTSA